MNGRGSRGDCYSLEVHRLRSRPSPLFLLLGGIVSAPLGSLGGCSSAPPAEAPNPALDGIGGAGGADPADAGRAREAVTLVLDGSEATLEVASPWERSVFQRAGDGWGRVPVSVRAEQTSEARLVARLEERDSGDGPSDWFVLSSQESRGAEFAGVLEAPGGWYRLEIALEHEGAVIAHGVLERVGIGEVFFIAGQSNAEGWGGAAATDDRVNVVSYASRSWTTPETDEEVTEPSVSPIDDPVFEPLDGVIGPRGGSGPYYWGRFGDELTARLEVPVLLFNAGWGGTAIQQWADSARGVPVWNQIENLPYGHLANALSEWAPLLGARAVLWHQGEANATWASTDLDYAADLRTVIAQSRSDAGAPALPWFVARVSLDGTQPDNAGWNPLAKRQVVLDAQNEVIAEDPQVFAGPDTDAITADERPDGVHFSSSASQERAAALWLEALSEEALSNARPLQAGEAR